AAVLSHLLDLQAAAGKGAEQLLFQAGQVEPRQPFRLLQYDHLPVVDRRDVGAGLDGEERECVAAAIGHRAPQPRKAEPVLADLCELPLRFWRLRASELEEMGGRDQATAFREASAFGTEVDDRRSLGPGRRKAPAQLHQLDPILAAPKYRSKLDRKSVVARLEIRGSARQHDRRADLAECCPIIAVWNVLRVIIAHR